MTGGHAKKPEPLMTLRQAGAIAQVHPHTVSKWITAGSLAADGRTRVRLRALKLGRLWRVARCDLEAFGRALAGQDGATVVAGGGQGTDDAARRSERELKKTPGYRRAMQRLAARGVV